MKKVFLAVFLPVCLVVAAGCSKLPGSDSHGLESRLKLYIQAVEKNDCQLRYSLMDPGFKKQVSLERFCRPSPVRFSQLKVQQISWLKKGKKARVRFTATLVYNKLRFRDVPLLRMWEYVQGEWYVTDEGDGSGAVLKSGKQ